MYHRGDLIGLGLPDQVTYRRCGNEDLQGHTASFFVDTLEKDLGYYSPESVCQGGSYLLLLFGRKDLDHAVYCLVSTGGMQSTKDKMSRRGCLNSQGDRFKVSHLTHQDNVRVFPKSPAQGS